MAKDEDLGVYIYEGEGGEVVVPEGYTAIGMSAFAHSNVTSVTIPKSVKVIGVKAFMGCDRLVRLVIESPDVTIKSLAFLGCDNLCELILPENFKAIDVFAHRDRFAYYRFYPTAERAAFHALYWVADGMPKGAPSDLLREYVIKRLPLVLQAISKEGSVKYFNAFLSSGLVPEIDAESLDIMMENASSPHLRASLLAYKESRYTVETLQRLQEDKIAKAFGEKEYELSDYQRLFTVTEQEDGYLLGNYMGKEKNVFLPDTLGGKPIVGLEKTVFIRQPFLESIRLPATLKTIGESAFNSCEKLRSVEIPASIRVIGGSAFAYCRALKSVRLGSGVKRIDYDAFTQCRSLETVIYEGTLQEWCESELFQNGILENANEFVIDGKEVVDLVIPQEIKDVGRFSFTAYKGLRFLRLQGVRFLRFGTFWDCTGLTHVTIGKELKRIAEDAFAGCTALREVLFEGTREEWDKVEKQYAYRGTEWLKKVRCSDETE